MLENITQIKLLFVFVTFLLLKSTKNVKHLLHYLERVQMCKGPGKYLSQVRNGISSHVVLSL